MRIRKKVTVEFTEEEFVALLDKARTAGLTAPQLIRDELGLPVQSHGGRNDKGQGFQWGNKLRPATAGRPKRAPQS